jgi:hypothetical protein
MNLKGISVPIRRYMFRTPKKLTKIPVMGTDIQVVIDDKHLEKESALGLYHNNSIILRSKYDTKTEFIDTLSHEVFHALCCILGTQFDDTLEEVIANTLGQTIAKLVSELLTVGVYKE